MPSRGEALDDLLHGDLCPNVNLKQGRGALRLPIPSTSGGALCDLVRDDQFSIVLRRSLFALRLGILPLRVRGGN